MSTSFKKEISILSHIAKSYRPDKNAFPKKIFVDILKTVLLVDLTLKFWVSSLKNVEFMNNFYTSLLFFNSFVNIDGPLPFLLYDLEC